MVTLTLFQKTLRVSYCIDKKQYRRQTQIRQTQKKPRERREVEETSEATEAICYAWFPRFRRHHRRALRPAFYSGETTQGARA